MWRALPTAPRPTAPLVPPHQPQARHRALTRRQAGEQPQQPPAQQALPQQQQQQQQPQPQPQQQQQPPPQFPRRALLRGLAGAAIALGGNLGGVTSWLLGLDGGQLAGRLHLDVLIPVAGFKRCLQGGPGGFEFLYPASWLADQTLYARAAQRAEEARSLDPPSLARRSAARRSVTEPLAAFGPPGSSGEENVSVIVAPIFEGFELPSLGDPQAAAQTFLDSIAAPAGSDKQATLVAASQRTDAAGTLYYSFEFTIRKASGAYTFDRHNVAVLASRDNLLYTLTAQCPAERWAADGAALQASAASFRLMSVAGAYPGRL